ncbi:hypothetical protein [Flindersiella endophytica]
MRINYNFGAMAQGAGDIAHATNQVADLHMQFETAMGKMLIAYQSRYGSAQAAEVRALWVRANEEVNRMLRGQGLVLDDAWTKMDGADKSAAKALDLGRMV